MRASDAMRGVLRLCAIAVQARSASCPGAARLADRHRCGHGSTIPDARHGHWLPRAAAADPRDGELDDAAWRPRRPMTAFVQREPSEGAPPTLRTEARVAFDDSAMYVAVRAFDPEPDRDRRLSDAAR